MRLMGVSLNATTALGVAVMLCFGCTEPPPPAVPQNENPPPPITVPEPPLASDEPEAPPPESKPRAADAPPPLTNLNLTDPDRSGFTHNPADPAAPLLRITTMKTLGKLPSGTIAGVFIEALAGMYACHQTQPGTYRVSVRFTIDAAGKAQRYTGDQRVVVEAPESELLWSCFERVVEGLTFAVPAADPKPFAYFTLQFWASGAPKLRSASAPDKVTRREGGTCWELMDYPCAPNKVCQASEHVRVRCPSATP